MTYQGQAYLFVKILYSIFYNYSVAQVVCILNAYYSVTASEKPLQAFSSISKYSIS